METMARSLQWSKGRLLESQLADGLLNLIGEFVADVRQQQQPGGIVVFHYKKLVDGLDYISTLMDTEINVLSH